MGVVALTAHDDKAGVLTVSRFLPHLRGRECITVESEHSHNQDKECIEEACRLANADASSGGSTHRNLLEDGATFTAAETKTLLARFLTSTHQEYLLILSFYSFFVFQL